MSQGQNSSMKMNQKFLKSKYSLIKTNLPSEINF
jgi:hypothetical protein